MITFTIALVVLILGYWIYGSYVNRVFGPDNRQTPALTKADGVDFGNSVENQMKWLESLGFDVVEYKAVTAENLDTVMDDFAARIASNDFPSDGLVAVYDDIEYGRSLGRTAKFRRVLISDSTL